MHPGLRRHGFEYPALVFAKLVLSTLPIRNQHSCGFRGS
jgi:hypothetical protein